MKYNRRPHVLCYPRVNVNLNSTNNETIVESFEYVWNDEIITTDNYGHKPLCKSMPPNTKTADELSLA